MTSVETKVSGPSPPTHADVCGSMAGVSRHSRRREKLCEACLPVKNAYNREWHMRTKDRYRRVAERLLANAVPAPVSGSPACRDHDPELFFPDRSALEQEEKAKAVCRRCPLRWPCLEGALDRGEQYGVWGGFSEKERRKLR